MSFRGHSLYYGLAEDKIDDDCQDTRYQQDRQTCCRGPSASRHPWIRVIRPSRPPRSAADRAGLEVQLRSTASASPSADKPEDREEEAEEEEGDGGVRPAGLCELGLGFGCVLCLRSRSKCMRILSLGNRVKLARRKSTAQRDGGGRAVVIWV